MKALQLTLWGLITPLVLVVAWCSLTQPLAASPPADSAQVPEPDVVEDQVAQDGPPRQVEVGIFLTNLFDIDLHGNQYSAHFWVWFLHDDLTYQPLQRTEVVNAKRARQHNEFRDIQGGSVWDVMNVEAVINEQWNIKRYPFDTQVLNIHLEDIEDTASDLQFIADTQGSRVDESLIPDGWQLSDYRVQVAPYTYDTRFGDPSLDGSASSDFSRISLAITLEREGQRLFITVFIGFFVATIFVTVTLAINMSRRAHPVIPLQPRVTLASGAIFATIGSIYLLVNEMPYTTDFTLADSLLTTTSVGTVLSIISSFSTDVVCKNGNAKVMYRVNKWFFAVFVVLHLGINTLFLIG